MERERLEPGDKILVLHKDSTAAGQWTGVTKERVFSVELNGYIHRQGQVQMCVRYGAGMRDEWEWLADEGVTWCRGWDNPEVLVAADTLARSAE
jgi:hypothetical protein